MQMGDPYQKVFEDIVKGFGKFRDMILWIAQHTLTVTDYKEFMDKFTEKKEEEHETCRHDLP